MEPKKAKKLKHREGEKLLPVPKSHLLSDDGGDPIWLMKEIKEKRLDAKDLTREQRLACLSLVMNDKHTLNELSHLFKVSRAQLARDARKIRLRLGRDAKSWGLDVVLGDLVHSAEKCYTLALKQEDPGLAWSIKRDLVRQMKELNVIGAKDQVEGLKVTIETLGVGYDRAREQLARVMDPRLTGEVLDDNVVEGKVIEDKTKESSLPLALTTAEETKKPTEVVVKQRGDKGK